MRHSEANPRVAVAAPTVRAIEPAVPQPLELAETHAPPPTPRSGEISVRLGSVPSDSAHDLRFVQDRLALLAKITFLISSMFVVATGFADYFGEVARYTPIGRASHIGGTLVALAMWLVLRRRRSLSARALEVIDVVCLLAICWSFAALGHFALQPYGSYIGLLAVTHVSVTRAMIVPSTPRRSFMLSVLAFSAIVLSRATMPIIDEMFAQSRGRLVLEGVLWSTAGVAVTTVASVVIYGLQAKAREARQLGQYTLEEKIGEGGMGEVYRAHHAMLRRPTAVKLLSGNGSEDQLRRFEKEVQLTARLTHPNTISIYDYGRTPDGTFYYAMELLDGWTLEELVNRHGPLPPGRVIHVLQQVAGALAEAHGSGLIHRDIKPENIYLCRRGDIPDFVKVLDFGLVREMKSDGKLSQSNINTVVGTPLYMSPDAILTPDKMDGRADIYGLGCVAYFLLTGRPPFEGKTVVEICAHHLQTAPTPPSEIVPVPDDLERVVLSCLAKERERRPQTARELLADLRQCRDAQGWSAADAEEWWVEASDDDDAPSAKLLPSGEHARRTLWCADLGQRAATRQEPVRRARMKRA
jgi:serine/threonine protein kinase